MSRAYVQDLRRVLTPPERVLFVRLTSLGDVLRLLPVIRSYKAEFPRGHLGLLTSQSYGPLLDGLRCVDSLHLLPNGARFDGQLRSTLASIRKLHFERLYNFHPTLKAGILSFLTGIRDRFGFGASLDREGGFLFARTRANPPISAHRLDQYVSLVRAATPGLTLSHDPFRFSPPLSAPSTGEEFKTSRRAMIAILPGSSPGAADKRWPAESFTELGNRLQARTGCEVVFSPGIGETDLAMKISEKMDPPGRVTPEWNLPTLAGFLKSCRLAVSGDTGPGHLAATLGVPTVMVFGPTDPLVYGPRIGHCEIVGGKSGWGRPHRGDHRAGAPAMRDVSVQAVLEAALVLFEKTRALIL